MIFGFWHKDFSFLLLGKNKKRMMNTDTRCLLYTDIQEVALIIKTEQ